MREPVRDKNRLEHIVEAIDNINAFSKGKTIDDLATDKMMFYAIVKNIEIIGEAAFKLTKEFCSRHSQTPWEQIVKMRHVLVHDYYRISNEEVWTAITEEIQPLRQQIARYLAETDWQQWEQEN